MGAYVEELGFYCLHFKTLALIEFLVLVFLFSKQLLAFTGDVARFWCMEVPFTTFFQLLAISVRKSFQKVAS